MCQRGPDLSEFFEKPPKPLTKEQIQPHLPALFEDLCKKEGCKKTMELMPVQYCTRRKPFATFQCPACKLQLLLFEAPVTPLLVWSDSFHQCIDFSEFIDELMAKREHKREIRAIRYGLWGRLIILLKSWF